MVEAGSADPAAEGVQVAADGLGRGVEVGELDAQTVDCLPVENGIAVDTIIQDPGQVGSLLLGGSDGQLLDVGPVDLEEDGWMRRGGDRLGGQRSECHAEALPYVCHNGPVPGW